MKEIPWLFVCIVLFGCALILLPLSQSPPLPTPSPSPDGYGPGPDGPDSQPVNETNNNLLFSGGFYILG